MPFLPRPPCPACVIALIHVWSHSRHDCLSTEKNTFDAAHNLRRVAEYKLHRIAEGRE